MRVTVVAVVVSLLLTGCSADQLGLNFQRASLRSAGDMGATTTLEIAKMKHVEHEKAEISAGCTFTVRPS